MYGRSRKSWFRMTGRINCTTSGIGVSGCTAVVELALAPPGEEVRLEANKMAETEIRPRARVICNAEARTELSCFFFICFFRWSSGSERRFFLGTPQASPEISLMFFDCFQMEFFEVECLFVRKACKRVKHLFRFLDFVLPKRPPKTFFCSAYWNDPGLRHPSLRDAYTPSNPSGSSFGWRGT